MMLSLIDSKGDQLPVRDLKWALHTTFSAVTPSRHMPSIIKAIKIIFG